MPARATNTPTPEAFLAPYHPAVQDTAHELRALVKATVPTAIEAVRLGWTLIGYDIPIGKKAPLFGFVAPLADRVALGFSFGYLLDDPAGLLSGNGKQVRQVIVRDVSEIKPEPMAILIREAARLATLTKSERGLIYEDKLNR